MQKQAFIAACREGGPAIELAFRSVVRDYSGALLREGWLALRDADLARDLLQETLLKVWRACASFRGDSELYPWLAGILRRAAIDRLRRQRPEVAIDDLAGGAEGLLAAGNGIDQASANPQHQAETQQSREVFARCAERFSAEQPQAAEVIRWIVEDGLAPADIAALIGRSPGATREYLSQCRKKARHYFADWYRLVGAGGLAGADSRNNPVPRPQPGAAGSATGAVP